MSGNDMHELLDAYVDGELDASGNLEFERHLNSCDRCRAIQQQREHLREALRGHAPYFRAPESLERRVRARIRDHGASRDEATERRSFWNWRAFAAAAAILIAFALILAEVAVLRRHSATDLIAHEVVASHVRSLMANHLTDVASSDQHTVKPWFSGKLDFAPTVKDLTTDGFPLIGGRLDYLNGHPVAALLYKRRQHTINLFQWPTGDSDSAIQTFSISGFNLVRWTRANMAYWAVSDLNERELREFVSYQQR